MSYPSLHVLDASGICTNFAWYAIEFIPTACCETWQFQDWKAISPYASHDLRPFHLVPFRLTKNVHVPFHLNFLLFLCLAVPECVDISDLLAWLGYIMGDHYRDSIVLAE